MISSKLLPNPAMSLKLFSTSFEYSLKNILMLIIIPIVRLGKSETDCVKETAKSLCRPVAKDASIAFLLEFVI